MLRDSSHEGSGVLHNCVQGSIFATRQMLRKLSMTPDGTGRELKTGLEIYIVGSQLAPDG
jgi:hypothetical protein